MDGGDNPVAVPISTMLKLEYRSPPGLYVKVLFRRTDMESDVKNLQRFFPEESKACLSRRLFSKEHKAQKDIDQMVTALETSANCQEPDLLVCVCVCVRVSACGLPLSLCLSLLFFLCVCTNIYIYIYIYTHRDTNIYALKHKQTHAHTHTHIRTHPHAPAHAPAHAPTHARTCTRTHTHTHLPARTPAHTHTQTCICMCPHTWHSHAHTEQVPKHRYSRDPASSALGH